MILLTDSDGAGKLIRSHITSSIPKDRLIQLYIPKIEGKEKRKKEPSAEGNLGVEGMERELLWNLLLPFENEAAEKKRAENPLSKTDFYKKLKNSSNTSLFLAAASCSKSIGK